MNTDETNAGPPAAPADSPERDPVTGLTVAQIERELARRAAVAEAATLPLPGPLFLAFGGAELTALGVTFRPVVHSDHATLQRLESPFLRNLAELQKPEGERQQFKSAPEEVWEFVFLFTLPPREARALLAKGRPAYREAAAEAIGDRFHDAQVIRIAAAAREHYLDSWATAIAYERGGGAGADFTKPPPGPMMASAGG